MFTGIVEALGEVVSVRPGREGGRVLEVAHPFESGSIAIGDSVAHDGVCLTATSVSSGRYTIDAGPETLARTTLGRFAVGRPVNLERSVTLETRLGGHLVQGHVDAVGRVRSVNKRENAWDLFIEVPPELLRLVIPQGSVAVDGISLTVTGRDALGFSLSIIPHTWEVTSLRNRGAGAEVNVEADLIARYVAGLLEPFSSEAPKRLDFARLAELGYGPTPSEGG